MAQLRQDYAEFTERHTEIVVIGPENAETFGDYWLAEELPYVGLPDPKHSVLKLFGQEVSLFKLGRMPAQVIVDQAGTARFVHYGHDMTDIPENDEVLAILDRLNGRNE
jgi:peroxiredoxin Q/BCP